MQMSGVHWELLKTGRLSVASEILATGWNRCGRLRWLLPLFVLLPLGCGTSGPDRAAVQGTVTVAGKTLESGWLAFIPTDGNTGPTAGGTIENGEYSIPARLGPVTGLNRIQISGTRKTGRKIPNPAYPSVLINEVIEVVPTRYQADSTLQREVKPGLNIFDFELDSR